MKRYVSAARLLRLSATISALLALLTVELERAPVFAAEPPASAETIDMSVEVGRNLGEVVNLMDAGKFAEASAAMQTLRDLSSQERMNDYEELRMLQTAAQLNTAMQQYREAIADYAVILQMDAVSEAERLATADMIGQLYLQLQDWDKGLEYLVDVNTRQGGTSMETLFRIAFAYHQLGKVADAIPYMEQALVIGGDRAGEVYYSNMATLYMAVDSHAKAKATLEALIQKFPDSANRSSHQQNLDALSAAQP